MSDVLVILIVEDDDVLAMNLAAAVEDRRCSVAGPVATVTQALAALDAAWVDAAVLDANLLDGDVTPVAMALIERAIPFVIHTGIGLPAELASVFPHVSVIMKPADPDDVVACLLGQLEKLRGPPSDGAIPPVEAEQGGDVRSRQIGRIASALFDQFGDKAIMLARRQAADAVGDALATWSAIIEVLIGKTA